MLLKKVNQLKILAINIKKIETSRLTALQLLENDKNMLSAFPGKYRDKIANLCLEKRFAIESILHHDLNTEIINFRYGFD